MAKILVFFMAVLTSFLSLFGVGTEIKIDEKSEQQTVDGWGTSACWWSQMVDDEETRQTLAKELYSKDGLALNIYRYNIGGGVNPEHNRVTNTWRSTESFYYYNEESGEYEYDFTRDANAQAFLEEALKYGCIDTVILFANSPHYSMTITEEASGSDKSGGVTNLAKDKYQDYVDYFLTITEYFINKGVPVKYISPINEPQWDWGGDYVSQEGCHYDAEDVYELLKLFSKGIDERGLDVTLSCPESGEVSDTTNDFFTTIKNDAELYKNVGSFAYHSYWTDTNQANKIQFGKWLSRKMKNEKIDMTEWCELPCANSVDSIEAALVMGRVIANDFAFTGVNSWSSWVAVNQAGIGEDGKNYSDGLYWAEDDFSSFEKTERYYAMAHFSKYVPVGSVMLKSSSVVNPYKWVSKKIMFTTNFCAFKTPENKIVLVIVNEGDDQSVKLKLSAEKMTVITTDSEQKLAETYSGDFQNKIDISANSITTIIFE